VDDDDDADADADDDVGADVDVGDDVEGDDDNNIDVDDTGVNDTDVGEKVVGDKMPENENNIDARRDSGSDTDRQGDSTEDENGNDDNVQCNEMSYSDKMNYINADDTKCGSGEKEDLSMIGAVGGVPVGSHQEDTLDRRVTVDRENVAEVQSDVPISESRHTSLPLQTERNVQKNKHTSKHIAAKQKHTQPTLSPMPSKQPTHTDEKETDRGKSVHASSRQNDSEPRSLRPRNSSQSRSGSLDSRPIVDAFSRMTAANSSKRQQSVLRSRSEARTSKVAGK
jgi:hypothetical protein